MTTRRVVVTGMGLVSPLGNTCNTFFDNLLASRSGIRRLTGPTRAGLGATVAGEVDWDAAAHFTKPRASLLDRFSQFALNACAQAIRDSGLEFDDELKEHTGVFIGTGMGGAGTIENAYAELLTRGNDHVAPYTVLRTMNNAAAGHISIDYGFRGPNITYSTACSSSALAIGEAARAIRHGYVDAAIAGGAEALLTLGTIRAWEALRTLAVADETDPAASCRPFSKDRTGLVLGEGAGIVVLEQLDSAVRRGARIYAELAGYASGSDAAHLTKPSFKGQVNVMRRALADARVSPEEVDYVNAHGTATLAGDLVETASLKAALGEHASRVAVSSTKSMHGHLMGASGAVEFIAAVMAIKRRAVPPTANLRVPDPECDLDYVPNHAREDVDIRTVMSNSFAFGGSNAVLIARRYDG